MKRLTNYLTRPVPAHRVLIAIALVIAWVAASVSVAPGVAAAMAAATYNPTKTTDLNGLWRKVQGPLRIAANFLFPEWDALDEFTEFNVDWSTREITAPFDLVDDTGIASIAEGGREARPSSVNTVDGSFTWILLNGRFTITKTAKWIQQKSKAAMISDQMKFQGRKKIEAMGRRIKDYFWGFSTGTMAQVGTITSGNGSATIVFTVTNGYGRSDITSAAYLAQMFKANEWIAILNGTTLVDIGQVTAVTTTSTTCSLSVTFNATPTLAGGYNVVFANSTENTTRDGGTDYSKALTGFLDALTSTTVEGISGGTYPNWNPGYSNTAVGRFNNIKYRRMRQGIENNSPMGIEMDTVRMSQGVENDLFDQMQAGLRFDNSFQLELDGKPTAKGVDVASKRSVPPGYVVGYAKKTVQKMVLLPKPGQPTWDDAEKIPDVSGYVLPIDYPCQMVWTCRGGLAYESNKSEQ